MYTIRSIYNVCAHVGSTPKLPVRGDPVDGYVVAAVAIEVWALWCRPYADCFL